MLYKFLHTHAFKIIVLISTIFPFIGYLIGYSYYNGYMSAYGLSDFEFPLAAADIYYYAYLGIGDALLLLTTVLSKNVFYYVLIGCGLSLIFYLVINIKSVLKFLDAMFYKIISKLLKRFVAKMKSSNEFRLKVIKIIDIIEKIFACFQYSHISLLILQAFLISILIYWMPVLIFNQLGKDKAISEIQLFIKNNCVPKPNQKLNSCINILDENKKILYTGKLITYNLQSNRIAIMQKNEINIIQLKPDYIINRLHFYK